MTTEIVKAILIHDTGKALRIEQDGELHWVPRSLCHRISKEPGPPETVELKIESWFVEKEGLVAEP